jgi:hypothetical protein
MRPIKLVMVALALALSACATPVTKNYSSFRTQDPHSILVVPVLNNTTSLTAQDFFLSTVSAPFAERGYYVFPAHMVKSILEKEGMSDAGLVHKASPVRFGQLFGCDSVLLIDINRWESQYIVISTSTTVAFQYRLASCKDGSTLWEDKRELTYSPDASNYANPLAGLIASAIKAALEKADPNYMPLASQANLMAAATPGQGLPFAPAYSKAPKSGAGVRADMRVLGLVALCLLSGLPASAQDLVQRRMVIQSTRPVTELRDCILAHAPGAGMARGRGPFAIMLYGTSPERGLDASWQVRIARTTSGSRLVLQSGASLSRASLRQAVEPCLR